MAQAPTERPTSNRSIGQSPLSRRTVMRGMSAAGLGVALTSGVTFTPSKAWAAAPPNVIYISIDDLGWRELGCYGNTFNETPHIDRVASRGLRFTDAYSAAAICSPTRASLMTGQYPARVGITDYLRSQPAPSQNFLSPDVITIPEVLAPAGYGSGLIGKWHLTEDYSGDYSERLGNPYAHGFDDVRASETRYIAGGDYSYPYFFMPELDGTDGEYLTDRLTEEAVEFIAEHGDQPFFMHLSNYAVHTTLSAKPELVDKYRAKPGAGQDGNNPVLAAMLESIDDQVGSVVATLEELGIADNTLVMVMSDNGGDPAVATNAPLRGHKSLLYEGGIRVAFVAQWPDVISTGGVSSVPVSTVDVFPTLLDIAGISADPAGALDGESLAPIFRDGGELERDALYWVYPHFHFLGAVPQAAVRVGRFKLIEYLKDGRVELYDLEQDLGETTDLAAQLPAKRDELRRLLEAHIDETGVIARPPTPDDYRDVDLSDDFASDAGSYTVLVRPSGAQPADLRFANGALEVTGDSHALNLYRSEVAAGPGPLAVTVEMRSFAGGTPGTQDSVFVGLVKDEDNYVVIWHNNAIKRTGWDAVVNGSQVTRAGAEPLGRLEGEVDLSAPGARLSLVLEGADVTAYANQGDRWEYLFTLDIAQVLDLADPAVRSQYHYGFGVRLNAGTMSFESLDARRRPATVQPVIGLVDERIDAEETAIAVRVTADGAPVDGGSVSLRGAGGTLGTADVVEGVATIALDEALSPGTYSLVASYSGNDTVEAAVAQLRLTVDEARRPSQVSVWPRSRTVVVGQAIRVNVRVRAGTAVANGRVEVWRNGEVLAHGRLRRNGTARLAWTVRRPVGRQTYEVRYLGSDDVAPSADRIAVSVREPRRRR